MFAFDFNQKTQAVLEEDCCGFFLCSDTAITLQRQMMWFCPQPVYFTFKAGIFTASHTLKDFDNKVLDPFELIQYLNFGEQSLDYKTIYKHLCKVPSGARVKVQQSGVTLDYPPAALPNVSNQVDLVASISNSIKSTILPYNKIAAHVSGGLDSTGISAVLKTQYPEYNTYFCSVDTVLDSQNERAYQEDFEIMYNERVHQHPPGQDLYNFFNKYSVLTHEPSYNPAVVHFHAGLLEYLHKNQYDALVTGHGGDSILGHGEEHIATLIRNRDWVQLEKVISNFTKEDLLYIFYKNWETFSENKKYNLTLFYWINRFKRSKLSAIFSTLGNIKGFRGIGTYTKSYFSHHLQGNKHVFIPNLPSTTNCTDIKVIGSPDQKLADIIGQKTINGLHNMHYLGEMYNVKMVHPFLNKDILAISSSYTDAQKLGDGHGRMHYREAMKDLLPESILTRINKTYLDEFKINETIQCLKDCNNDGWSTTLEQIVGKEKIEKITKDFLKSKKPRVNVRFIDRLCNINALLKTLEQNGELRSS